MFFQRRPDGLRDRVFELTCDAVSRDRYAGGKQSHVRFRPLKTATYNILNFYEQKVDLYSLSAEKKQLH
jgi:hypothetical protein